MPIKPVVLIILDGWGIAPEGPGNAVTLAKPQNFKGLWTTCPHTQLLASGEAVGLPSGEEGNSEVGHLNLGAGRIVYQDLPRINLAIADGSFFTNQAFLTAANFVKNNASNLHLMGLIGTGGVHSSLSHLYALLRLFQSQGLTSNQVKLHLFTDGRDSAPTSSLLTLSEVENKLKEISFGQIASISGRYYAMDRDNRWQRTELAYRAIAEGQGIKVRSPFEAVERSYAKEKTDEFVEPAVIERNNGQPVGIVQSGDVVIFFNFRPDRARQLTKAFVAPSFRPFQREFIQNLFFVTMTEYEEGLPVTAAFSQEAISMPLARVLAEKGLRQLHISETEKYPHVTYFFNGGREDPFMLEDRVLIPSPHVATYDLKPEMSAYAITEVLLSRISMRLYSFIIVNFANPDMVGHTGKLEPGIKAIKVTDECLGKVVRAVKTVGGACLVTADHGNAEEMINFQTGEPDTEHSTNPVPFIAIVPDRKHIHELGQGILADIAPTILGLMGVTKPSMMTGRKLL